MMALTDDSLAWVLDAARLVQSYSLPLKLTCAGQGEHIIHVDQTLLGPTCGLLPVGVASSRLSTSGLEWNLGALTNLLCLYQLALTLLSDDTNSSFDSLVSTSNHVIKDEVWIKNTDPIVWTIAVK